MTSANVQSKELERLPATKREHINNNQTVRKYCLTGGLYQKRYQQSQIQSLFIHQISTELNQPQTKRFRIWNQLISLRVIDPRIFFVTFSYNFVCFHRLDDTNNRLQCFFFFFIKQR